MKTMKAYSYLKKIAFAIALFSTSLLTFTACEDEQDEKEIIIDPRKDYKTPKYVFYFIGDGMGNPQINATEAALFSDNFRLKSSSVGLGEMNIRKFPIAGMQTTHASDRYITGSAASATALATGYKTTIGTISMNDEHTSNYKTMAEMAKTKGMKVGIVSSVSIDHATPACFYAHANTRNWYNYIAAQMDDSGFDYFGGGYAKGNFEKYKDVSTPGKRVPEDFTPVDIEAEMKAAGYTIAKNKTELDAISVGTKCWAYSDQYDGSAALPYEVDRSKEDISLAHFTKRGIELLDSENGFFLMVEAGKVDWACHANDAVSATHDMVAFDDAIGEAIAFYQQHPDETLIVVTGDHECGGLTLGFASTGYETAFTFLDKQETSYEAFTSKVVSNWTEETSFEKALLDAKVHFGLGDETIKETSAQGKEFSLVLTANDVLRLKEAFDRTMGKSDVTITEEIDFVLYGSYYDPFTVTVTHILNQKAGLDWSSYSHSGVPIPVFAMGQGEYLFSGYYDNTDVAKKIIEIADFE